MKYVYVLEFFGEDGTQIEVYGSKKRARAAFIKLLEYFRDIYEDGEELIIEDNENGGNFSYSNGSIGSFAQWKRAFIK